MEQLNGLDSLFVYSEQPGTPMTISFVAFYDPSTAPQRITYQDILERFTAGIPQASIFRRRLVKVPGALDRPYWIDDPDFDVALHVRQVALPAPGNWQQFYSLIGRLQSQPLDMNRPLWETYMIEGLDNLAGIPPGCFALLHKVHHAAMDGMSGLRVFLNMHTLDPAQAETLPAPSAEVAGEKRPPRSRLLWNTVRNYGSLARRSGRIAGANLKTLRRVREGLKDGRIHNIRQRAHTRFNLSPSADRVVGRYAMDKDTCQRVCRLVPGATINDLALAVIAGAMRRYLHGIGELPGAPLVAGCPVNVRNRENRGSEQNLVGLMNVGLCTNIVQPLQRFEAIHQESLAAKDYHRLLGPSLLNEATEWLPPFALGFGVERLLRFKKHLPGMHNTLISNIHGIRIPLYFGGARLTDGFALGPVLPHCNLFHTVLGINGHVSIGFNACRAALQDRDRYLDCLHASWHELQMCLPTVETTHRPTMADRKTATRRPPAQPRQTVTA